jgi:hypothetical protein
MQQVSPPPHPQSISSVMDFGNSGHPNYSGQPQLQQPKQYQQQQQPMQQPMQQRQPMNDLEAAFMWDNFLQGLGIQNYDKSI